MNATPPNLDPALQYVAYLIMVDDSKRRGDTLPSWIGTDQETQLLYMNVALNRIATWQSLETNGR